MKISNSKEGHHIVHINPFSLLFCPLSGTLRLPQTVFKSLMRCFMESFMSHSNVVQRFKSCAYAALLINYTNYRHEPRGAGLSCARNASKNQTQKRVGRTGTLYLYTLAGYMTDKEEFI